MRGILCNLLILVVALISSKAFVTIPNQCSSLHHRWSQIARKASSSDEGNTGCLMTERNVILQKPMGIIVEELDQFNPTSGVIVKKMDPNGATAAASKSGNADICLHDKILRINDENCATESFETVMDRIIESPGSDITLTLARSVDAVVVKWPNGISVAAMPGEPLSGIARQALVRIPYSCTSGGCGTCEQSLVTEDGEQRYVRPCVARVPKGSTTITLNPSDRVIKPSS